MQQLNLPNYKFKFKNKENKPFIFDIVRKKYVILTPEEWVRQHIIHFLIEDKKFPISLIAVEKKILVNKLTKRTDLLLFDTSGAPFIIVECKSTSQKINQKVFDQIARYNLALNAPYLMVTNGLEHYYCSMNHQKEQYTFLKELPSYV